VDRWVFLDELLRIQVYLSIPQGGVAFVVIGQVFAEMALQGTMPNILLTQAQPWALAGICGGFFLWTFGAWWIILTVLGIYETFRSQRPSFAAGFWGMVFPMVSH
jgi:tellurite resistance protein TehA-like permease